MAAPHPARVVLLLWAATLTGSLQAATPPIDWNLVVNVSPATHWRTLPEMHPTSDDRISVLLTGRSGSCLELSFGLPVVDGLSIRLHGERRVSAIEPCSPGPWFEEVPLPPLPPGSYQLEVFDEELLIYSRPLEVFEPLRALYLGAFSGIRVTLELTDPRVGAPRAAPSFQQSVQAGYFWFFDPDNVEVTVKIIDARLLTGNHWLFVAAMTDLGFTLTIDPTPGNCGQSCRPIQTYVNQPGRRMNITDTIP